MLQNTLSFVHVSHRSNATVLLTAGEFSGLGVVNMTSTNGAHRVEYSSGTTVHLEDNFERLCDILLCIGGSVCPTFHNMPHQCDHGHLHPQTFRQVALNDSTSKMHVDAYHVFTQNNFVASQYAAHPSLQLVLIRHAVVTCVAVKSAKNQRSARMKMPAAAPQSAKSACYAEDNTPRSFDIRDTRCGCRVKLQR